MAPSGAGFHNADVRAARALHLKKHRQARRCFLVEGPDCVAAALKAGVPLQRVFVRLELGSGRAERVARQARDAGIEVLEVDDRTMRSLSTTDSAQGLVAVAPYVHRGLTSLPGLLAEGPALVLALHDVSDPGNAGTLVRSAAAFGAACVAFGAGAVDIYNEKLVRATAGALFAVPLLRYERWAAFAAAAAGCGLTIVAAEAGASSVRRITDLRRCALLVGNERHGLGAIDGEGVPTRVGIAQNQRVESLNASVAGSIALYEIALKTGVLRDP